MTIRIHLILFLLHICSKLWVRGLTQNCQWAQPTGPPPRTASERNQQAPQTQMFPLDSITRFPSTTFSDTQPPSLYFWATLSFSTGGPQQAPPNQAPLVCLWPDTAKCYWWLVPPPLFFFFFCPMVWTEAYTG